MDSYCQKDDHFPLQAQRFTMTRLLTKTIDSCPDGQMTEDSSYVRISDGCIGQGFFDGIPLRRFCSRVGSPQSPSFFGQIRVHLFWMFFLVTWISNWWKYMERAHLLNTNSANKYRECHVSKIREDLLIHCEILTEINFGQTSELDLLYKSNSTFQQKKQDEPSPPQKKTCRIRLNIYI